MTSGQHRRALGTSKNLASLGTPKVAVNRASQGNAGRSGPDAIHRHGVKSLSVELIDIEMERDGFFNTTGYRGSGFYKEYTEEMSENFLRKTLHWPEAFKCKCGKPFSNKVRSRGRAICSDPSCDIECTLTTETRLYGTKTKLSTWLYAGWCLAGDLAGEVVLDEEVGESLKDQRILSFIARLCALSPSTSVTPKMVQRIIHTYQEAIWKGHWRLQKGICGEKKIKNDHRTYLKEFFRLNCKLETGQIVSVLLILHTLDKSSGGKEGKADHEWLTAILERMVSAKDCQRMKEKRMQTLEARWKNHFDYKHDMCIRKPPKTEAELQTILDEFMIKENLRMKEKKSRPNRLKIFKVLVTALMAAPIKNLSNPSGDGRSRS